MLKFVTNFKIEGAPVSCERYGNGHINVTYLLVCENDRQYILQMINKNTFKNVEALMGNISAVTKFLQTQDPIRRHSLHLVPTVDGADFYKDENGEYWRMYDFITDSLCLDQPETADDFYQSAVAFGKFQNTLAAFPAHTLYETIPNFHNTVSRYAQLHEAMEKDPFGRLAEVKDEIEFALARENEAGAICDRLASGELPLRVTHNDTKLNNVMLDASTRKALCVIDLDTVMPGSALYDFGDSIRFGASTAVEDEQDLNKVNVDLSLFEAYTQGFLSTCAKSLTPLEVQLLPMGAKLMTLECGVRFLTDYLMGDTYFRTHRKKHNLDRCRTQFKLVADMELKWDAMRKIVEKIASEN